MSWRDGRDSCTCSCTLTGLPAQIPTELRRGSANKTQTVILEVPTCLTPHILTIPRKRNKKGNNWITPFFLLLPPPPSFQPNPRPAPRWLYTYILFLLHWYCYTIHYVACFHPVSGISRSIIIIYTFTHAHADTDIYLIGFIWIQTLFTFDFEK